MTVAEFLRSTGILDTPCGSFKGGAPGSLFDCAKNRLQSDLGLTNDELDCVVNDGSLFELVATLTNVSAPMNTCDPYTDGINIVSNAVKSICSSGNSPDAEDLKEELVNDDIVYDTGLEGCPRVYCIWQKAKEIVQDSEFNNENDELCDLLGEFINTSFKNVELQWDFNNEIEDVENRRAQTFPNEPVNGMSRIVIDRDLCSTTSPAGALFRRIEILGTIVHEFVHAEIYNSLYAQGYFQSNTSATNNEIWNTWVAENYSNSTLPISTQHQLMAQFHVDRIATVLWQLNDKIGQASDYLIIAWQGLSNAYEEALNTHNVIPTNSQFIMMQNIYLNNVEVHENNSPFKSCN